MCKSKYGKEGVRQRVRHHEERYDSCCGRIKEAGMNENETNMDGGTE